MAWGGCHKAFYQEVPSLKGVPYFALQLCGSSLFGKHAWMRHQNSLATVPVAIESCNNPWPNHHEMGVAARYAFLVISSPDACWKNVCFSFHHWWFPQSYCIPRIYHGSAIINKSTSSTDFSQMRSPNISLSRLTSQNYQALGRFNQISPSFSAPFDAEIIWTTYKPSSPPQKNGWFNEAKIIKDPITIIFTNNKNHHETTSCSLPRCCNPRCTAVFQAPAPAPLRTKKRPGASEPRSCARPEGC